MAEYTKRDIVQLDKLGGHYSRHVSAMTVEYLHRKSEVAAELAWRDAEIARLREALEFYAAAETWRSTRLGQDYGKRAREALGKP